MRSSKRRFCISPLLFLSFNFLVVSPFPIPPLIAQKHSCCTRNKGSKKTINRFLHSIRSDVSASGEVTHPQKFRVPIFSRLIHNLDAYRETSRLYRRTVFSDEDWVKYRSSGRLFKNLSTLFISGVIRGIWIEVMMVAFVSTCVYLLNLSNMPVVLPTVVFQLTSPALGLLLVFRTNTAYERWKNSRIAWEHIQTHCNNLVRQGMAYLADDEKKKHTRPSP